LLSSGAVTQTAAIVANGLALHGTGTFTLTNASNNVVTLAGGSSASKLGSLTFVDSDSLTIGTVGVSGLTASGDILVETLSGDLTVTQSITTTSTTATAIRLNAGKSAAIGSVTGGNVLITGPPTLTTGSGGRITLYTGSVSGSTGVTDFVGSGSGRFRYNADETTNFATGGWINLGSGVYAVYREQPTATVTNLILNMVYGDALPSMGATGTVNGDGSAYSITSRVNSTSGNIKAGTYTITSTLGGFGYNVTGDTSGTLTVTPRPLSLTGTQANNKVYDGTNAATLITIGSLSGKVGSDVVTLNSGYAVAFGDPNAANGKTVTVSGLSLTSSDADAYNYSLPS
jgi:hypothetical protein